MITTPPITIERFTELAHRTASRYSHRSEPGKVAYTFLPHTLEHFHHLVCADIGAPESGTPNPLRDTLVRLVRETGMARTTRDDEMARLRHIETAAAIATTALWQMDNHPACAALRGEQAAKL